VAAVIVRDGDVLATGQNRQNTESDVTWHAEFEAIRTARGHTAPSAWRARRSTRRWSLPDVRRRDEACRIRRLVLGARHAALAAPTSATTPSRRSAGSPASTSRWSPVSARPNAWKLRRRWGKDQVRAVSERNNLDAPVERSLIGRRTDPARRQ
jgi:hypothetical protein